MRLSENNEASRKVVTVPDLQHYKLEGRRIVMITAYDFSAGLIGDRAGVDAILVGDSVGMMALGYKNVLPVTLDDIIHHTCAVSAGVKKALVVADLPFGSYQAGAQDALRAAVRLLKEGGARSVKMEGGENIAPSVAMITASGVPVMGHLGLTPQSVHQFGGHKLQATTDAAVARLISDAKALEQAGAWGVVLEMIPAAAAHAVTQAINIPTVGIGAGPFCDGQVQVWHDLLSLPPGRNFHHVKQFANLGEIAVEALKSYANEVRDGKFPTEEHSN